MAATTDNLQVKLEEGIQLPAVDGAMNKLPPTQQGGGRGSDKDEDTLAPEAEQKLLGRMRKRFARCMEAEAKNRADALDDLKFKAGQQWPADIMAERKADYRPCLTINKIPTFVNQITNDQRQNRPAINVAPLGDRSDKDAARVLRGMIRAIERDCAADIAYDTAFDQAVSMGWGYWRILTRYESPETFDQVICIERVRNPFTVYLDPDRQEPDGSDAKYGFITEMIPREEFRDTYPDAIEMAWNDAGIGEDAKAWASKDQIRVAEYYEIENKARTLVMLANGHQGWEDDLSEDVKKAIAEGWIEVLKSRKVMVPQWYWVKATAVQVIQRKKWAGQWLPIVEVVGNEIDIEGKVMKSGVIRNAKDPQRMYNYWSTAETEMVALAPKAPFILEEGQVEGHEAQWKQANRKSYPFLLYKGTSVSGKPAPPPQRQPVMGPPGALLAAKAGAAEDMQAVTGIRFDATKGERLADESGRAMRELKRVSDIGSFHYIDNFARSLKHTGRILVDLIPKIYDTVRTITILREDDKEEAVKVNPYLGSSYAEQNRPDGKSQKLFNPTVGRYGVTVIIGPSYASKRIEAADSMMQFARAMPQTAMLIADLIAKSQDWPGAEEMAARLAKALPPNLLSPEQKDVPPQVQALLQSMDQQIKQLGQERQQLMAQLSNQDKDRQILMDKINKDFEAKVLKIAADSEDKFRTAVSQMDRMLTEFEHRQQLSAARAQQPPTGGQPGISLTGGQPG